MRRLVAFLLIATILLLLPLIAQQYTDSVHWNVSDFLIAGGLLFGTGLIAELVLRNVKSIKPRVILLTALLLVIILIWIELAVGIFGSPFGGN